MTTHDDSLAIGNAISRIELELAADAQRDSNATIQVGRLDVMSRRTPRALIPRIRNAIDQAKREDLFPGFSPSVADRAFTRGMLTGLSLALMFAAEAREANDPQCDTA